MFRKEKLAILLGILLAVFSSGAQGLVEPSTLTGDTITLKSKLEPGNSILISDFSKEILLNPVQEINMKLDLPDFKTFLNSRWIYLPSAALENGTYSPGYIGRDLSGFISPFLNSGVIFNQAAYKVSDRLIIGGSSFGARSIFSAPLPGNLTKSFDTHGATMFFQYKITPKFRIETRVTVTNHSAF